MIMISSKAGQRLARARSRLGALDLALEIDPRDEQRILDEYTEACAELADELIAGRHHEAEGD